MIASPSMISEATAEERTKNRGHIAGSVIEQGGYGVEHQKSRQANSSISFLSDYLWHPP